MNVLIIGGWYFMLSRGRSCWIGLAKQEPFVNGHPIYEPGELWFAFGDTPDAAMDAIKRSVLH